MPKRAGVFIDGANLFYIQKHFLPNSRIDFIKLASYMRREFAIYNAFYYMSYDPNQDKQSSFVRSLIMGGLTVIRKPLKKLPDGSYKGNLDVELAIDALLTKDNYEVFVLCSGDSDYERLLWALRHYKYIDLKEILPDIQLERGHTLSEWET